MIEPNFTQQDILSALLGFIIFPCVLIAPGYVTGWLLDLFDFKQRRSIVKLGIGLVLSFAVSPIVLYLTSSLLSLNAALLTLTIFIAAFAVLVLKNGAFSLPSEKILWGMGIGWAVFAVLSLVNIQWGDRLFYSVTSFDQTTRVSIIDAMTRTGVPPVNPGYFPGEPVRLTFVYYFWYILCSLVDVLGVQFVDARGALNASSAWVGLGVMAVIALYIRLRNASRGESAWRSARIGVSLLAVSGLDILPIILLMVRTGQVVGSIDVWNTWIQSWVASALWVPHHLAALLAGMCAILLVHSARGKSTFRQFVILAVAGLAFASAFGLSVYVTLVFVVFWCIWTALLFIQRTDRSLVFPMIFSGLVALALSAPFLSGLFQGGGDAAGQFPVIFEVRTFLQLESFVADWSPLFRSLIMLAVLPINYLFELGIFFLAGLYWFQIKGGKLSWKNPFYLAEVVLFGVVLLIGSSLRSTLIASNDLGWRAWLPGQFILLVWCVDVLENFVFSPGADLSQEREARKNRSMLLAFISIGVLTTIVDAALLRTAWPLMTGPETTRQYYSARLAYEYLRDHIPADAVTQNNPLNYVDRPSGLYGTHQMVISDRTAYGISARDFEELMNSVSPIFNSPNPVDWRFIDRVCLASSIDILIFADTDPVWRDVPMLKQQRVPLYENERYAIYACGQ